MNHRAEMWVYRPFSGFKHQMSSNATKSLFSALILHQNGMLMLCCWLWMFSSLSMWPSLCRYSAWCDRSSQSSRSFIALHAITVYSRPSIINRLSLQSLCWISFLFGAASSFSDILRLLACFIEATTDIFGYGPLIMSHGAESHVTCWDTTVVRFSGKFFKIKITSSVPKMLA